MKQHTQPCKTCPFLRTITPGETGGAPPEAFVGQCHGNFFIPCHCNPGYRQSDKSVEQNQCAGVAIYRANVGKTPAPGLLSLPPDTKKVFATPAEFIAHHEQITVAEAERALRILTVPMMVLREYQKIAAVQGFVALKKKEWT